MKAISHRPTLHLAFTLEARDRQGRLLRTIKAPSRSYVRAFLDTIFTDFGSGTATLVPDTGGVNRTIALQSPWNGLGLNDNSLYGPVLGTGINAVAIGDNKLQTQVVHGTAAGTLDHQLTEALNLQTVGATRSFQLRRLFVNASGGPITINECGIYATTAGFYFCFVRDLVSPGVSIPNGGTGTLIYTISITA